MDKVIYFDNNDQQIDRCSGQVYHNFLDYAFDETDYFMLVYVNYNGNGYSKIMKDLRDKLKPYKVKSRTNPSWPGTPKTWCNNTTYQINFYRNTTEAKELLKSVDKLSDWSRPSYPQDLAFFKGNQCWFYSVGHEKIGAIIHANEKDIDFVEANGLALRDKAFERQSAEEKQFFGAFDEDFDKH